MAYAQRGTLSAIERPARARRWLPRRFLTVYLIWLAVTALVVTPEIARYDAETARIRELAAELAGDAPTAAEAALRITHAVQERVRPRHPAAAAPGLGATAWSTWANGIGDAREGARLVADLLLARGIAASPLVLTDSRTGFRHIAVGYADAGTWRLIDGLGAPRDFHDWSEANDKPLDRLVAATRAPSGAVVYTPDNPFFDRYSFFDWQSLLGDTAEVYQRVPFPGWLVAAIDSPPILTGLVKIAGAFGVLLVLRALWLAFARPKRPVAAV